MELVTIKFTLTISCSPCFLYLVETQ